MMADFSAHPTNAMPLCHCPTPPQVHLQLLGKQAGMCLQLLPQAATCASASLPEGFPSPLGDGNLCAECPGGAQPLTNEEQEPGDQYLSFCPQWGQVGGYLVPLSFICAWLQSLMSHPLTSPLT